MLLLHRYNKSKSNTYPWLIDESLIDTINDTRYGTLVIADTRTDDAYVVETVEQIAKALGAKYVPELSPEMEGTK